VVHARLEQVRAQRRSEAEREERREQHRHRDGQRELLVDRAGAAPCNALGTNTAASTTVIAITAPVICCIALTVASRGEQAFLGHDALDVLDHHDRIVDRRCRSPAPCRTG
jgi:hypothetical protein